MNAKNSKKISVVGAGYVGLSLAVLLSQENAVTIIDIDKNKLKLIDKGKSPIKDKYIEDYLSKKKLKLNTSDNINDVQNSDFILLAVPTNFDHKANSFDTSILESLISEIVEINDHALIVIKSTLPIGWINNIQSKYTNNQIIFNPEFLREGNALYDNLYPSRIIIGSQSEAAREFGDLLKNASLKDDTQVIYTNSSEAEAIKLFSNSYLAMRVAFFNEVDNFALYKDLNSEQIITGISLDPRIGNHYNNPSFGYGGYCLPKDTKQLLSNFENISQDIIGAIVQSNETRLNILAEDILSKKHKKIGVYKLEMKKGSDNHRDSATSKLIQIICSKDCNTNISIYEPNINEDSFLGKPVIKDFKTFKENCDLILCNRKADDDDFDGKIIYSRDLYGNN